MSAIQERPAVNPFDQLFDDHPMVYWFYKQVRDGRFVTDGFSWLSVMANRIAEPCVYIAVAAIVIVLGSQALNYQLPNAATIVGISGAVLNGAPEIILAGTAVLAIEYYKKREGWYCSAYTFFALFFLVLTIIIVISPRYHWGESFDQNVFTVRCVGCIIYSLFSRVTGYKKPAEIELAPLAPITELHPRTEVKEVKTAPALAPGRAEISVKELAPVKFQPAPAGGEKTEFVEKCLAENPTVKGVEIQRLGELEGLKISAALISGVRKNLDGSES